MRRNRFGLIVGLLLISAITMFAAAPAAASIEPVRGKKQFVGTGGDFMCWVLSCNPAGQLCCEVK